VKEAGDVTLRWEDVGTAANNEAIGV